MKLYKDISRDSGIHSYKIGPESITIRFKEGSIYLYTYASAGSRTIETMKKLAVKGKGLSTFISRNVKRRYALKLG